MSMTGKMMQHYTDHAGCGSAQGSRVCVAVLIVSTASIAVSIVMTVVAAATNGIVLVQ